MRSEPRAAEFGRMGEMTHSDYGCNMPAPLALDQASPAFRDLDGSWGSRPEVELSGSTGNLSERSGGM